MDLSNKSSDIKNFSENNTNRILYNVKYLDYKRVKVLYPYLILEITLYRFNKIKKLLKSFLSKQ